MNITKLLRKVLWMSIIFHGGTLPLLTCRGNTEVFQILSQRLEEVNRPGTTRAC